MPEVAATPAGGAEGSARPAPAASQPSPQDSKPQTVQERLKAQLFPTAEPQPDEGRAPAAKPTPPKVELKASAADGEAPIAAPDGDPPPVDASDPDVQANADGEDGEQPSIKSLTELAEGLGWDLDKVLDLEASTKINGKEGKVALREILKSHQLEGHLNQGLMKLAEERKGFEAETARKVGEVQARVQQLNQAVGLAQKILDGEFADTNWQELQRTDPAAFQAKYGAYKMRLDGIQQLNQMVGQESERVQAQQQAEHKAYLDEQGKLLESKIPEWSDAGKREKDVAEMATVLNEAYGITEQELKACVDHRQILLARDALRWQKLQKSKPATLNKVRAAPKLIRPGAQQSRTAQDGHDFKKGQEHLRRTGKVKDATPLLKKLLFN
jgi:hypothetical protein